MSLSKHHTLQMHVDTVHLKLRKFPCHLCEYRYGTKQYLRIHIQTVHERKPNYNKYKERMAAKKKETE